jgi:hypothetical protein
VSTDPHEDEYLLSLVEGGPPEEEDPYGAAIIALDQVRGDLDRRRQAGHAGRPGLQALTRGQLANLPRPEPLIEDTLDRRTVALLAGGWGTLKSFIALDWAASVATGRSWMGRPTEQGRALYVSAEGAYGLHARLSAWETAWRRTIPDSSLSVIPEPVNLMDAQRVDQLAELAAGCALVVVDTFARCMVGADENSARDVGLGVDALYRLRAATGDGTVLVVHHTGKDRLTVRGSSALEAGVDTAYLTEGDARLVKLSRTKRKDGPREDEHQVRFGLVPGTDSGVVESTRTSEVLTAAAEKLWATYEEAFDGRRTSKAELRAASDLAPASFFRALTVLLKAGRLVQEGTEARPIYTRGDAPGVS